MESITLSSTSPQTIVSSDEINLKVLGCIIMLIRNLSYVSAKLLFLAHSQDILRILIGCFYFHSFFGTGGGAHDGGGGSSAGAGGGSGSGSGSGSGGNLCLRAIHALINLVPYIDITGRKIFADMALIDPTMMVDIDQQKHIASQKMHGQATTLGFGGMLIAKRYDNCGLPPTSSRKCKPCLRG